MFKVLVYPRGENPYQTFLYKDMETSQIQISYYEPTKSRTINLVLFYFLIPWYRFRGYTVFHLHWIEFCFPFFNMPFLGLSLINTILSLLWIKLFKFKMILTTHNIIPHTRKTLNDLFVMKCAVKLATHIIVHSQQTVRDMQKYGINLKSYSVIPIGPYVQQIDQRTHSDLRIKLEISKEMKVLLFFGFIRKNKGIDRLLHCFDALHKRHPDLALCIAGKTYDPEVAAEVTKIQSRTGKTLSFFDQFIPDEQIQQFFDLADACVFPFEQNTSSSSVLLALSYYKPIIAPRIGNIVDLPESLGYFYDPTIQGGLGFAIETFMKNGRPKNFDFEVEKYLKEVSWKSIARKTENIFTGKTSSMQL